MRTTSASDERPPSLDGTRLTAHEVPVAEPEREPLGFAGGGVEQDRWLAPVRVLLA